MKAAGLLDPVDDAYDELVTANEAESPEAETLEEALLENPEESA